MSLCRIYSGDPRSTAVNLVDPFANTTGNKVIPELPALNGNALATFVSAHAYTSSGGGSNQPVITAGPDYTFGTNDKPAYNPAIDQIGTDPGSDNGQVAANAVLRIEQFGNVSDPGDQAQLVMQALGQHKNDPLFLQQYLGTLGADRTAKVLRDLTSLGHVQTPYSYGPGSANAKQIEQQYHDVADALSTLVKSKDFNQKDMDRLVAQFANDSPEQNFTFASDVLSKASPQVNQMFYQSAKTYALALQHAGSTAGQAMAAYAMQALLQSSNPMVELEKIPKDQLRTLVQAAMKGEASYGNPPTLADFAKTGIYRAQNGQGAPLSGLSNLMFDSAYADIGDRFGSAPLSTAQAHDLQSRLFQASISTLQSDPSVKVFYNQSVPMKDALAADFQAGYDSIVKAYSGQDGELNSTGMQAFQEFFADALFSPPPSSNALDTAQFFQSKLNSFITDANKLQPSVTPPVAQHEFAKSMGEQAAAMALGLKESLASIRAGSAQATSDTQAMINLLITGGEAGVGALGPGPAVGAAIVGEALKLLVPVGSDDSAVQNAISDLKKDGIDVTGYTPGGFQAQSESIMNVNLQDAFQLGMANTESA